MPPNNQKRSRRQEKSAERRYGMRRQPASGALIGRKSDLVEPGVRRMECKETTAMSYSLRVADLIKLEKEARAGEDTLFEVEFQGVYPHRKYVVLPVHVYERLHADQDD